MCALIRPLLLRNKLGSLGKFGPFAGATEANRGGGATVVTP
jgi:hypothetical protein